MKGNLAIKITNKDAIEKAKVISDWREEITNYERMINGYQEQIMKYEEVLRDGKVPKDLMQWTNTLLNNFRGALSCANKYYLVLKNTQPEKLGGQK